MKSKLYYAIVNKITGEVYEGKLVLDQKKAVQELQELRTGNNRGCLSGEKFGSYSVEKIYPITETQFKDMIEIRSRLLSMGKLLDEVTTGVSKFTDKKGEA